MSGRRSARRQVVIIGGGVMGCACAWRLAQAGADVTVLERSVPGAEASSAAGGIVGAQAEAHGPGPMADLLFAGRRSHEDWAAALAEATGLDTGLRLNGILRVTDDAAAAQELAKDAQWQRRRGKIRRLSGKQARRLEPSLGQSAGGVLYADDGRIDPPLFFRAVHIAARRAGARFRTGAYVERVLERQGRASGVRLDDESEIAGDTVLLAAGSWSTLVQGTTLGSRAITPARGQMLELSCPVPPLERIVFGPRCYVIPRDDGRVIIGSTLEFVGYQRDVTAGAVRELLDAAITLVPSLASASMGRTWSNFRPYTKDELPLLGRSELPGLLFATGHYRTGILLAPITAEIILALHEGRSPPVNIDAFAPRRLDV